MKVRLVLRHPAAAEEVRNDYELDGFPSVGDELTIDGDCWRVYELDQAEVTAPVEVFCLPCRVDIQIGLARDNVSDAIGEALTLTAAGGGAGGFDTYRIEANRIMSDLISVDDRQEFADRFGALVLAQMLVTAASIRLAARAAKADKLHVMAELEQEVRVWLDRMDEGAGDEEAD